jgi:hypothetical protein
MKKDTTGAGDDFSSINITSSSKIVSVRVQSMSNTVYMYEVDLVLV